LFALVKAAEQAGESKGGAVLWIHGPQPGYNNEMYIMSPYAAAPAFFEMALDDCLTDANEFFKNHKEIGPFNAVPRSGPLADDLQSFLSKWQPGAKETYVDLSSAAADTKIEVSTDKDASREVAILDAANSVNRLIAAGKKAEAAAIGVRYHIVTPVSGAVVLGNSVAQDKLAQNDQSSLNAQEAAAPMLEGAVNGTVGPQGADATVIQGINTAGTVRVNNIANLEALLNIVANGLEILGMIVGGYNFAMGAVGKSMVFPFRLSSKSRLVFGICIAIIGLVVPTSINWLLASARDANLFS
ncbi:MAG: hypothetical protein K2X27_03900, partial [Candidatus Obscuribacterales bacterium]|nr:hypothetical protein [Candidatus Obscuribacterales bacterium]